MITPTCSQCRRTIPAQDVNAATDVAYCRDCNISYQLSELTYGGALTENLDVQHPPAGAWHSNDGMGTVIGATHRSLRSAAALLGAALFWNGIVSLFVLLAMASTLHHLHIPLPDGFPAPKMNGEDMGTGMTIFLWIFLTPFIAVGLFLIGSFFSSIFGRTEVRIHNALGTVFTGCGPIGMTRRFDASQVKDVRIADQNSGGDQGQKVKIVIETRGGKQIKFGSMLTDERRKFMAGAARLSLVG